VGIAVSDKLYESFTGQATLHVCSQLVDEFKLKEAPQKLVQIKRRIFKELFFNDPDLKLIDSVEDLIKDYHQNGLTLILASSASMPTINSVFKRFELDQYFKAKLSGADLKASKPHPEIFLKGAEASGFKREQCMVIEDSTNGIKAAHAAGIYCVAYKSTHSKNQDYSLAHKVIETFEEIDYEAVMKLF
jgi:HAD superfamily hydrolase (TIGR01509 family)